MKYFPIKRLFPGAIHTISSVVSACLLMAFSSSLSAQEVSSKQTQPLAINLAALDWGAAHGGNGFPVGVRTAPQGIDPVTGGVTYYALFPAGSRFDLHWHTHDEFVSVVKGPVVIELGDQTHTVDSGGYIVIPGKMKHSWDVPAEGGDVIILVRRAGPADFHFVGQ